MPSPSKPLELTSGPIPSDVEVGPEVGPDAARAAFDATTASALSSLGRRLPQRLQWTAVRYTVRDKELLHGVSGQANPGELLALMGPSGAGKTTLLNVLAGRITSSRAQRKTVAGSVRVNDCQIDPATFRKRVAFVTQEDQVLATATARESLEFSAKLRLDASMTPRERADLVDQTLAMLGLTRVQDTIIGWSGRRGLSGGERKRVAIGIELIASPSLMFLDEPTSGLDSFSAWKVVRILAALVRAADCTVVCSIHQPSAEVVSEFTHLYILASGHVVYQGSSGDFAGFISRAGYPLPPNTNIAEHAMFIIQTTKLERLPRDDDNSRDPRPLPALDRSPPAVESDGRRRVPGFIGQVRELCRRELVALKRDQSILGSRVLGSVIVAALVAVIFVDAARTGNADYTVATHLGVLVMILICGLIASALPALLTFPVERVVFTAEWAKGCYSSGAYLTSKTLVELPITATSALLITLVVYWAVGLNGDFGMHLVILFLEMEAIISLALIGGSLAPSPKAAIEFAPVAVMPQVIFAGLFIRLSALPVYLRWVQYVVALAYAIKLALVVEFDGERCPTSAICAQWAAVVDGNAADKADVPWYLGMLVVLFVVMRALAWMALEWKARQFDAA